MSMFCFQCQETAQNKGCTVRGVCGKTSDVANLQDLLIFVSTAISRHAMTLHALGETTAQADKSVMESLFMTITNANFDKARFVKRIHEAIELRDKMATQITAKGGKIGSCPASTNCTKDRKSVV